MINASPGATLFVSLDGTDYRIMEPTPFDKKWYSFKFNGPGLRYEIALAILTGHIVWANGGLPCGDWPDLRLARNAFVEFLEPNEKALADKGYNDTDHFVFPSDSRNDNKRQKVIMARHETVNRRMKEFAVLGQRFRHALHKHPMCFHACLHLTQLMIEHGHPLFIV